MATASGSGDRGGCGLHQERLKLGACVVGVVGSLLVYGVLQERVMTIGFKAKDGTSEVFKFSLFLVACNRLVTSAVAAATLLVQGKHRELRPVAPLWCYASVSLSNVIATTCQYEALKWVSFAVQTLGKCAKMFPVMLWGLVMMKRKYSMRELGAAISITAGCFVFFMSGNTASRLARHAAGGNSSLYGLALMAGYLTADGYTSTFQDRLFKGHAMTTYNQVLYTSLFSIILSMTGLITSGQLLDAMGFLQRHPDALLSIFVLSGAATAGSLCISYTIKSFGALIFAMIMTTRQFLSILLSSLIFGNKLTAGQWAGTAIVFVSLYYQTMTKPPKAKHSDSGKADEDLPVRTKGSDLEMEVEPMLEQQDGKQAADKLASTAGMPRRTAPAADAL